MTGLIYDVWLAFAAPNTPPQADAEAEYERLKETSEVPLATAESCLAQCEKQGIGLLRWGEEGYPERLLKLARAPRLLSFKGDTELLKRPVCALCGTRRASREGIRAARETALSLGDTVLPAADAQEGIGCAVHENRAGRTLCVSAGSLDCYSPAAARYIFEAVEQNGLIMSERLPGTGYAPSSYMRALEILCGLSDRVILIEAPEGSNSLKIAEYAKRYGVPLYAFTQSIYSVSGAGSNRLIGCGAQPLTATEDAAKLFGIERERKKTQQSTEPEVRLLENGPLTLSEIAERLEITAAQAATRLTMLEIEGRIKLLAGGRYALD